MSNNDRFSELLALEMASGTSIRNAAVKIGVSEAQAYRLAKSPFVVDRVAELRTEATAQAVSQLSNAASLAVTTLVSLMDDDHEPNIRLNAAKAVLANVAPISEFGELRARVDEMENSALKVSA